MNVTDDPQPWYGKGPTIPDRATKVFVVGKKFCVDGEDVTQMLTVGFMHEREALVDTLPESNKYEDWQELETDFIAWLKRKRTKQKNGSRRKGN